MIIDYRDILDSKIEYAKDFLNKEISDYKEKNTKAHCLSITSIMVLELLK